MKKASGMGRRAFLGSLAAATGCTTLKEGIGRMAGTEAHRRKPNIVLVFADQMRAQATGYAGNATVKTPHLDAFARKATQFSRFYVSPVCAPTRASLMTGRYNYRTGVTDVFGTACQMAPAEVTVAEVLRTAGYVTGIFGSQFHFHAGRAENLAIDALDRIEHRILDIDDVRAGLAADGSGDDRIAVNETQRANLKMIENDVGNVV